MGDFKKLRAFFLQTHGAKKIHTKRLLKLFLAAGGYAKAGGHCGNGGGKHLQKQSENSFFTHTFFSFLKGLFSRQRESWLASFLRERLRGAEVAAPTTPLLQSFLMSCTKMS